jgi:hypothetical protein
MGEKQLELRYPEEGGSADPEQLMTELCESIDRFNEYWPQFVVNAGAFRIPLYEDGLVPEKVFPECASEAEAVDLCAQSFRAFSRPKQQHPGSVYRVPGYIVLDRLLLDEIDDINSLKRDLQASIKQRYPDARARNVFHGRTFPGRIMLQVYRQIRTVRSPVEAVRFTWSPGTHAVTHLTKGEAIALLRNRLELGVDIDDHRVALLTAIDRVSSLNKSAKIIRERPRAPYPVASLIHTAGRNGIKKMVPLSLPLFIGPGISGDEVDVGTLAPYDANVRRSARSDRIESTLLFSPLYLRYR